MNRKIPREASAAFIASVVGLIVFYVAFLYAATADLYFMDN